MSCAAKYSFVLCQGSTFNYSLIYTDSSGSAVDLTDYGARMQLRPSAGSSTLYLTLSSSLQADGTGVPMTTPISGTLGVYISAASSSMLDFDQADYDLFIYSGSFAEKLLEGRIQLDKRVTL